MAGHGSAKGFLQLKVCHNKITPKIVSVDQETEEHITGLKAAGLTTAGVSLLLFPPGDSVCNLPFWPFPLWHSGLSSLFWHTNQSKQPHYTLTTQNNTITIHRLNVRNHSCLITRYRYLSLTAFALPELYRLPKQPNAACCHIIVWFFHTVHFSTCRKSMALFVC